MNIKLDENDKTILELKLNLNQLSDMVSASKSTEDLSSKNEELYNKIKNLEINNLTNEKEIKNLREEKNTLSIENNEIKNIIESFKLTNNELKQNKDKLEKENEENKKNLLETDKQKNKLKEDLEMEKKKMESYNKIIEIEQNVKDKKIIDSEIKLNEVKNELKVLQNSYLKLQQVFILFFIILDASNIRSRQYCVEERKPN